jgi:hypothetical protein
VQLRVGRQSYAHTGSLQGAAFSFTVDSLPRINRIFCQHQHIYIGEPGVRIGIIASSNIASSHAIAVRIMKSMDASSSTIARFPLEVLEIFVQYSTLPSQMAIAQVSKTFHSLALRSLYRNISLFSYSAVLACCQTLKANHSAARAVRSFMISYTYVFIIFYKD